MNDNAIYKGNAQRHTLVYDNVVPYWHWPLRSDIAYGCYNCKYTKNDENDNHRKDSESESISSYLNHLNRSNPNR